MFSTEQANRANYATAGISIAILLTRVVVGRWRRRPIDLALWLLLASIVAISFRISLNYEVLRYGTVNDAAGRPGYFKIHNEANVVKGSKIILASRVAITVSLWLQVCLLLLFYSQILQDIQWIKIMIRLTWVVAGLSFLVVILLTFLECRPFHLYWQIDPPPGKCVKAYGQLLSQCICNIILDLMLLVISFPLLLSRGRNWTQSLRIGVVFMLGTFCLVVTILRLAAVYGDGGQQQARTLWGAVQIIVSSFVANAPTIYGDVRVMLRRREESRKRSLNRPESWSRGGMEEEAPDGIQSSNARERDDLVELKAISQNDYGGDSDDVRCPHRPPNLKDSSIVGA